MCHADHEGDGTGPVVRPAPVSEAAGELAAAARPAVAPAPRTRRCHIGTRACPRPEDRLPSAPAGLSAIPFTPAARPGMTHRDGQSMRRLTKSTHTAESVLVAHGSQARQSGAHIDHFCALAGITRRRPDQFGGGEL